MFNIRLCSFNCFSKNYSFIGWNETQWNGSLHSGAFRSSPDCEMPTGGNWSQNSPVSIAHTHADANNPFDDGAMICQLKTFHQNHFQSFANRAFTDRVYTSWRSIVWNSISVKTNNNLSEIETRKDMAKTEKQPELFAICYPLTKLKPSETTLLLSKHTKSLNR